SLSEVILKLRSDERLIYSELEIVGKSFDEVQSQNSKLIKELSDKEEAYGRLLAEKLRAEFAAVQAKKESEISLQKAMLLERESLDRLEAAESRERSLQNQLSTSISRVSQGLFEAEKLRRQLADMAHQNSQQKLQLEKASSSKSEFALAAMTREFE